MIEKMAKGLRIPENTIYVCGSSKCKKRGGKEVRKFLEKLAHGKGKGIKVLKTGCTDNCKYGPIVCFQPQNKWYDYVDIEKAQRVFGENFGGEE
jgi:(2Fe-2S) ferredoxin